MYQWLLGFRRHILSAFFRFHALGVERDRLCGP